MGESLILRFYEFFNGQPVAIEQLLDYRKKVEQYIDAIGSGEYVPKLSAIKTSVTQTIKNLQAQGVTDIEKMELVNDPKPTLAGPRGYVPPPPAAFAAMQKNGTLWPSKRTNPFAKKELTNKVKTKVVEVKPDNIVAEEIPLAQIHTDTKRFQNRQGAFSEASAQSVAENFDPNKFDPIVVWRDPKAKKLFVLSGHSRYEGMKRRKSKTIPVRYFKGSEEKAIQFAKVEANRAANQENLIEDLAAYKLMRDGDKARGISKATKGELQRIFKGKASKLESYSYLSDKGLFVQALNQSTTSNYPYLERNAQWVGILRMQYPVISNQGEDNIFHFFYSDKSGKNIKLSKEDFFGLAKKKINTLKKGESVLFPECSSEGCKQIVDRENDTQKGESFKRLREINEQLESITEKLTSKDATVRVTTDEEKKYLRTLADKLQAEKERINRDLDLIDKSQASLFGGKTDRSGNFIGDGKFHAEFDVFEFSDFPQVKSKVEKSSTTESVYVHYFNTENDKAVTVRYSNHENNATKFGDQLNGHTTTRQEVLYKLGILRRKFIPNLIPSIPTQQVKKSKLKDLDQSDKTIQELYEMVRNKESIAKYVGKLTKGQNYLVTGEGVIIEDKGKDVFGNVIVKGKFEYFDPKLNTAKTKNKKERINRDLDLIDKSQASLFGLPHELYGIECGCPDGEENAGLGFTKDGQNKIYDMITNMILKIMKEGKELPWQKPWAIDSILATNLKSKKPYKGANMFLLNLIAPMFFGKTGPYWLTYKQAQELGGNVKKGASGFPVIYYSTYYTVNRPKKQTLTEDEYRLMSEQERIDRGAFKAFTINYYTVFAQEDIEGIEFPVHGKRRSDASPIETAQQIIDGMPNRPEIIHHTVGRAYYSPSDDHIKIPSIDYFKQDQEYYSTLFHELIHSTGHQSRLNRFSVNKEDAEGKDDYAFEELIAEMGASYLNAEAGTLYYTMKNSATYLKGWQKKLEDIMKEDNKFFLKASAKAAQAADYILAKVEEPVLAGPQIDAFNIQPKKKHRGPLNPLQMAQLQDAIKAGRTPKVNLKAKINAKAKAAPLFEETVIDPKQTSLFGSKAHAQYKFKEIELGPYKKDFDRMFTDTIVQIHGMPGHGKTVWMLKFAQYRAEQGEHVLYVAREEFGRSVFAMKLSEHNIGHKNLRFTRLLTAEDLQWASVVFLDSVSALKLDVEDVEELSLQYANRNWILILQSTKAGDFRGANTWEHLVDVAGEIRNRKLILRKNRLDPNNSAKREKLLETDAIAEAKKKAVIKNAVKASLEPKYTKKQVA